MKKRTILVISLLCLLALTYFAIFGIRGTRVEAVQNLVSRNLKIGASSDHVASFLDVQHLEHSKLIKPEFMLLGGHNYGNQNVIAAIKRNTWMGLLQRESIQLVFVFNENDELVRFDVFQVYSGL